MTCALEGGPEYVFSGKSHQKEVPGGYFWGVRGKKENPQSSGERQIPLPFKELTEPNKFPSEHFSILRTVLHHLPQKKADGGGARLSQGAPRHLPPLPRAGREEKGREWPLPSISRNRTWEHCRMFPHALRLKCLVLRALRHGTRPFVSQ